MRFSGHETFPFRYAWLPKAYAALAKNPMALADMERAMTDLGLGKNMLKALRFWLHVTDIARPDPSADFELTPFGHSLLSPKVGHDPYVEDVSTLWLLHWKIATHAVQPVFAWSYLFNDLPRPEFTVAETTEVFIAESTKYGKRRSKTTAQQHLDVFLSCYIGRRTGPRSVREDTLDCPLVELGLVQDVGERTGLSGARETVYAFNRDPKHSLSDAVFAFALADYWRVASADESTLSLRSIQLGHRSPGKVFQLGETNVLARLERIHDITSGLFTFHPSAAQPMVSRQRVVDPLELLPRAFPTQAAA